MNIPLNINFQQILLHLLNFAILGFGLYFLLYKPVKDFMDKRKAHYAAMKDEAEDCLQKAKEDQELCRKQLEELDEELSRKRREAMEESSAIAERRMAEAEAQARKLLADARENARREHEAFMDSARDEVSAMAAEAVRKLIKESVSDSYDEFLDAAERSEADGKL